VGYNAIADNIGLSSLV